MVFILLYSIRYNAWYETLILLFNAPED
uniref:Uncharacterized protein n=1 Tax=Rhizophora mucronata TaxID=61149 RepID=A0A2P2L7L7_RHIMU